MTTSKLYHNSKWPDMSFSFLSASVFSPFIKIPGQFLGQRLGRGVLSRNSVLCKIWGTIVLKKLIKG